jgi:hypothetical protein
LGPFGAGFFERLQLEASLAKRRGVLQVAGRH